MSCAWCLVYLLLLQVADSARSTSWPAQTYGLLKPNTGCPDGWEDKGSLYQDTLDNNPSNNRSEILHIDGYVSLSYVLRSFCIKTNAGDTRDPLSTWPPGNYCVYRKRGTNSLIGMAEGRIRMKDQLLSNLDRAIYINNNNRILYWISWSRKQFKFLQLYFFCKTSGSKKIPISLPITKPFYLLPYGSPDCQQVQWMVATSEWIKYHTRDNENNFYTYGEIPYLTAEKASNGVTMYYCYYQSCKYTLTDKEGVFQSPGFPGKYPDGQLCSWSIMVPDNHTLYVRFSNFSLEENDNVTLFNKYNGSFHLNDTFQGHQNYPFTIKATRDVQFVFRTNEEGNSTGFRAEYTLSKTSETTTSPPSTKRNVDHTTTIPTPGTKNKTNNSTADTFHKSRIGECDCSDTTVLVVIPLICLIAVIAIVIIFLYRWRSMKMKCEKCESTRYPKEDVISPTYDDAEHLQTRQRISTATMNTTVGTDDNDGQMYQALSHDQQPQYEAPDYSKQNTDEPSMDSGYPEYNELEPMDTNGPGVVYDVLEAPDSNGGPGVVYDVLEVPDSNGGPGVVYDVLEGPVSSDQMYQALNKETTHDPLYQSTTPATMVTRNPMYADSVA